MKEDKSIHLGTPLCESMIQLVIWYYVTTAIDNDGDGDDHKVW
jgi:hypothetical protein